jgi:hypothetical protein
MYNVSGQCPPGHYLGMTLTGLPLEWLQRTGGQQAGLPLLALPERLALPGGMYSASAPLPASACLQWLTGDVLCAGHAGRWCEPGRVKLSCLGPSQVLRHAVRKGKADTARAVTTNIDRAAGSRACSESITQYPASSSSIPVTSLSTLLCGQHLDGIAMAASTEHPWLCDGLVENQSGRYSRKHTQKRIIRTEI